MLGELYDVQTVSAENLLETTLETISKTCIEAAAEGRPVLVLIFSRGPAPAYSIVMGGNGKEDSKFLTKELFRQAIGSQAPEAGLCLLATEYYTGAWAINPDVKVAPFASQGKYFESLAWPISGTINMRPCGPDFAHAVTDMLLRLGIEGYVRKEYDGIKDYEVDEAEERLKSIVEGILQEEESKDKSLFSGNDEWEVEYSDRIGIYRSEFLRRYQLLKDTAPGYDELLTLVKSEAEDYLNSFPGIDNKAKNMSLHNELRGTIKGTRVPTFLGLESLRRQIDFRLKNMKMATKYKNLWGLTMNNCEDVEVETGAGVGTYRWTQLLKLVESYYLFDYPNNQGHEYEKGEWYIASCIHSQDWDDAQAAKKIGLLISYKITEAPVRNPAGSIGPIVCSWRQEVRGFSNDQDLSALQKEAKQYFNGKLRKYDFATDIALHNSLRYILNGTKKGELVDLRYGVDHRINEIMGTATLYKDFLGIEYPDCHKVDTGRISKQDIVSNL